MADQSTSSDSYQVPALVRALSIIETLADHPDGMGISEIAEALEIPKNSVFRIMSTLHEHGYLGRDSSSKRFMLSNKFLALGYTAISAYDLQDKAMDVMRDLRESTGETVLLGTLVGNEGVVLEQVASHQPVKFLVDVGTRFPIHTGAPGKAMLAFLPLPEQERILATLTFTRYNDRTITTLARMRTELEDVRRLGYAVDHAEQLDGVHCVAAPIFDHRGHPIAGIWVTGPSSRLLAEDFARVAEIVIPEANRISHRLGYDANRGTGAERPASAINT